VDPGLLAVLGVRVVAGRGLAASDVRPDGGATGALVNRAFADRMAATGAVLGRRVRLVRRTPDGADGWTVQHGPWAEVVGVMPDFTVQEDFEAPDAKIYLPAALAGAIDDASLSLAVRVRGTAAASFAPRLRRVAAAVDPSLQIHDLQTAADLQWETQQALRLTGLAVAGVTASVLLLSAAGIYAMMAFTVARRRREIGIRSALGADARRVLTGIFARASAQVAGGVAIGVAFAAAVNRAAGDPLPPGVSGPLLALAAALMLAIGLLAAFGPARRGLAVQPTEALREE
jgi:hypothetical protein